MVTKRFSGAVRGAEGNASQSCSPSLACLCRERPLCAGGPPGLRAARLCSSTAGLVDSVMADSIAGSSAPELERSKGC